MSKELTVMYSNLKRRLCLFTLCFSTVGMSLQTVYDIQKQDTFLMVANGLLALLCILSLTLYLIHKINNRTVAILLCYALLLNMIVCYPIYLGQSDVDKIMLRDVIFVFFIIFMAAFILGRTHSTILSILYSSFFILMSFISGSEFLKENFLVVNLLFAGGCFTLTVLGTLMPKIFTQYEESQEKVLALNTYKRRLMHLIVHDLKVPLSSIIELSRNRESTSSERIHQNAVVIEQQILNLLDVEKLDDTNIVLDTHAVNIQWLIHEAIQSIEIMALKRNITVLSHFNVQGFLICDFDMMKRVLINMISNALKFSTNSTHIDIFIDAIDDTCSIRIKDYGKGIDSEFHEKVFERFFHVKGDSYSDVSSTGLGLSFCKQAVNAHQGTIQLISSIGNGTEFIILLPHFERTTHNEKHSLHFFQDIVLNSEERKILQPLYAALINLEIYQISDIVQHVNPYKANANKTIRMWCERLLLAIYSVDKDHYELLINSLSYETAHDYWETHK